MMGGEGDHPGPFNPPVPFQEKKKKEKDPIKLSRDDFTTNDIKRNYR